MSGMARPRHSWLEQRHRTWHVRLVVPAEVREIIGAPALEKSLHTQSLAVATERARTVLVQWQAEFDAARNASGMGHVEFLRYVREARNCAPRVHQAEWSDGDDNILFFAATADPSPETDGDFATAENVNDNIIRFPIRFRTPSATD